MNVSEITILTWHEVFFGMDGKAPRDKLLYEDKDGVGWRFCVCCKRWHLAVETICVGIGQPSVAEVTTALIQNQIRYMLYLSNHGTLFIAAGNVGLLELPLGYTTIRDSMRSMESLISEMLLQKLVKVDYSSIADVLPLSLIEMAPQEYAPASWRNDTR